MIIVSATSHTKSKWLNCATCWEDEGFHIKIVQCTPGNLSGGGGEGGDLSLRYVSENCRLAYSNLKNYLTECKFLQLACS